MTCWNLFHHTCGRHNRDPLSGFETQCDRSVLTFYLAHSGEPLGLTSEIATLVTASQAGGSYQGF